MFNLLLQDTCLGSPPFVPPQGWGQLMSHHMVVKTFVQATLTVATQTIGVGVGKHIQHNGDNMTEMTQHNINRLKTQAETQIAALLTGTKKEQGIGESLNQVISGFGYTEIGFNMLKAGGLKLSLRGGLSASVQADIDILESALAPLTDIINNLGDEGRHLVTRGSKKIPSARHSGKSFVSMIIATATRNAKAAETLEATE